MAVTTTTAEGGPVWAAQAFLLSLLIPFYLPVGTLVLMPHRLVLLAAFVPFFLMLFVFRSAGRVLLCDWLLLGAVLWAGLALLVNHPEAAIVEAFGIFVVEFFGAYLLARVAIRSGADFRRMVRTFFFIVAVLTPFAALESLTHRAVLLELIPRASVSEVGAGIRLGLRRAQTVFAHPILYGIFVSTGLGLFWYALRPRWLRFLAVPMVGAATLFSLSTGALISFVMQALFIGWETVLRNVRVRWKMLLALALTAYVLVDLLSNRTPFHVLVDYASFTSGSAYNRILIWQYGTQNVWANPVFGLGQNDWARPVWMVKSVDNFWLLLTMQYGLPAIAMILGALLQILRRVSRAPLSDEDDRLCRAAYLVAFGGLFIAGGTVHYWHAMMAFVMFVYGSGLWIATGGARRAGEPDAPDQESAAPRLSRYTRQTAGGSLGVRKPQVAAARSRPALRTSR